MGKNGKSTASFAAAGQKKILPFVSVCTPTFNRRPFIETMFQCFRNQTYPKHRMEWIIVDDGTDKINDLVASANIPQIKYFALPEGTKLSLGAKRNFMHDKTKGSILVYMDDDDYYPPERVEHAVERLLAHPHALCSGSSEIYVFFKHIQKMIQCGPYGPNHATAGTFAFKRELLAQSRYEDHAALAEEKAFLKNYTVPFVQLDPLKSILVFSHEHNTFDKRKLLENPDPRVLKESPKTVDSFIRKSSEADIKDFFMNRIDGLLLKYEPGEPKMKPDVLKQIKEIEAERAKMMQEHQQIQIMIENPGQPPRALSQQEIAQVIQQQQGQLKEQHDALQKMEQHIQMLEQRDQQQKQVVMQLQRNLLSQASSSQASSSQASPVTAAFAPLLTPASPKVAIVIFVMGEKYIATFNKYFKNSVLDYCFRHNYDLKVQTELIRPDEEALQNKKKFFWQRFLVAKQYADYDFVVSMDSDIFIHKDAPALPLLDIPAGAIAAVNERKYMDNNYEWRERVQEECGWEKTGKDWHAKSGFLDAESHDHVNGGLIIYQPRHHAELFAKLYDENVGQFQKYHQDDQSFLSMYLLRNAQTLPVFWLDGRFNRIWFFWKHIFYPQFDQDLSPEIKRKYVQQFIGLNYFTHFTSGMDINLLI